MTHLAIAHGLQLNDKEEFDQLLGDILFNLRHFVSRLHFHVELLVHIVVYPQVHFKGLEDRQLFEARLQTLRNCTSQLIAFVHTFRDPMKSEIYAPYGETQWDEMFRDLSYGVKQLLAQIQHIVKMYTTPELVIPEINTNIKYQRIQERFDQFPNNVATEIASVLLYLDEDGLKTRFSNKTYPNSMDAAADSQSRSSARFP